MPTNDLTDEEKVQQVAERQGWNDATMLDLMGQFIYGSPERTRKFLKAVKAVAKEENAGAEQW